MRSNTWWSIVLLCFLRECNGFTLKESFRRSKKLYAIASIKGPSKIRPKFIIKPAEALNQPYHEIVRAAHLRHILLHTSSMATLALDSLKEIKSSDPFGELSGSLSLCEMSKKELGRVGWIDNPFHSETTEDESPASDILPEETQKILFEKKPKGGDTLKIESPRGWHLIRVDDLLIDHAAGPKNIRNGRRRKLPGAGFVPSAPSDPKEYAMMTTGCQMNVADSERMEGVLQSRFGLTPTSSTPKADVVVINTCTIRDHAEQKLYDMLGPIAARKRRGEEVALVVTGCVAQQEGEALIRRFPEVDMVMGPQYVNRMENLMEDVMRGFQVVAVDPTLNSETGGGVGRLPVRGSDTRAWVNVIFGCNEHCTYCVVPGVRGVEQSRPMEFILKEIQELEARGYKEVTLLGQNIDAYGRDMMPKRNFADLLHYLNENVDTLRRIRYVTSHPRYFSDNVIDAVANLDKVCECFHMPFQSGDDEVLQNMRRGYTFESYMKIIDNIRKRAPDASITGDVIVGFPGETDEAFQRTLDLMEAVKFDNLNSFSYSQRPNTEAANWDDQIPEEVKAERLQMVQRLAVRHALERSERYLGKVVEVLVEEANSKDLLQVMGRTRQNRQVFFEGDIASLKGELVMVIITDARPWSLTGKLAAP